MTVKSIPCYYVECDHCGMSSTDDVEPTCWPDEATAADEAIDCGWLHLDGCLWLCEECRPDPPEVTT